MHGAFRTGRGINLAKYFVFCFSFVVVARLAKLSKVFLQDKNEALQCFWLRTPDSLLGFLWTKMSSK